MIPKYYALIPARGGSEGIPKKNLEKIGGLSLVARTLNVANSIEAISQVFLSSDDAEILVEGSNAGATIVKRSPKNSNSTSTANDVVLEFFSMYLGISIDPEDYIIYLQPTSPLRTSKNLQEAIDLSKRNPDKSVVSVVRCHAPLEKLVNIQNGEISSATNSSAEFTTNRQGLTSIFAPNGAIYIFKIKSFLISNDFPIIGAIPYEMSVLNSIDIDSYEDLEIARKLEGH